MQNDFFGTLILGIASGLTIAAIIAAIQQAWQDRQAVKKEIANCKKALYTLAEKIGNDRKTLEGVLENMRRERE